MSTPPVSMKSRPGELGGIAPLADVLSVRAFDDLGRGTYADVIRAIDWVVANKASHNIRILNLSFGTEPRSYYWDDPMNQAVMAAWQAGIVVVASAGNTGPDAMTIGAPGNVPYVITVGAMTDNYTPENFYDDFLASFSSAGPTVEGFVKPDMVAPGGHARGLMKSNTYLATTYDELSAGVEVHRIHGDCHLGNLLLRDDVFWVLDFDDMVVGPAVQDLWLALPGRDDLALTHDGVLDVKVANVGLEQGIGRVKWLDAGLDIVGGIKDRAKAVSHDGLM